MATHRTLARYNGKYLIGGVASLMSQYLVFI